MKLQDEFEIPAGRERAWTLLQDIPAVAACLPGAELIDVKGDVCRGRVKVKIGPIVMVYEGELEFLLRDRNRGSMIIGASGRDKRGAGTVAATIDLQLAETRPDETTCSLTVGLDITGKPVQFGRAAIQDVSARLVGQFATNLAGLVEEDEPRDSSGGVLPEDAEAFDLLGDKRRQITAIGAVTVGVLLASILRSVLRSRSAGRSSSRARR